MPASDFRDYSNALNQASLLAQRDLSEAWEHLADKPPAVIRNALIEIMYGLVVKYGQMTSVAAAEYYETERTAARSDDFNVELADSVPFEQVEASVRYACGHLDWEDTGGDKPKPDTDLFGREIR